MCVSKRSVGFVPQPKKLLTKIKKVGLLRLPTLQNQRNHASLHIYQAFSKPL